MTGTVAVTPAPVQMPAVTSHFRATVTNAAQTLEACMATAIPNNNGRAPTAVYLGTESGAGNVFVTWDGVTDPTTTLGFILGGQGAPTYIPIAPFITTGQIRLIASSNPTYVQVKFDFGS